MFKKIHDDAKWPERATKHSAGFDIFAIEDTIVGAGETKLIGSGIALSETAIRNMLEARGLYSFEPDFEKRYENFMQSHYFALHIRSSLRAKGLTSLGTGVIDLDYRGEIKLIIHNPLISVPFESMPSGYTIGYPQYPIKKGEKVGQLILCEHMGWLLPSEYTKDTERTGGFGSTGDRIRN